MWQSRWNQREPANETHLAVFDRQVKGHRSPFGGWGACCTEDLVDLGIPENIFSGKLCCRTPDLTLDLHIASCQHLGQVSWTSTGKCKLLPPLTRAMR